MRTPNEGQLWLIVESRSLVICPGPGSGQSSILVVSILLIWFLSLKDYLLDGLSPAFPFSVLSGIRLVWHMLCYDFHTKIAWDFYLPNLLGLQRCKILIWLFNFLVHFNKWVGIKACSLGGEQITLELKLMLQLEFHKKCDGIRLLSTSFFDCSSSFHISNPSHLRLPGHSPSSFILIHLLR